MWLRGAAGERVSVAKLQVGLLGSARALQRQLDRIASRADTTSPAGLHYILQGALTAPEYRPSAPMSVLAWPCLHAMVAACITTCAPAAMPCSHVCPCTGLHACHARLARVL